jgi:molybdate transport system permease protein
MSGAGTDEVGSAAGRAVTRRVGEPRSPGARKGARPPLLLALLATLAVVVFVAPLAGLLARTPWRELPSLLAGDIVFEALRLSAISSLAATAVSAVIGVPLAWVLARVDFPGRALVRGLVLLPLVLPPVVSGAALLFALGRRGLIGAPLHEATGLVLPFSIWGVVLAVTYVAMPFLVITVEGALRNLDPRFEGAAATLGATRWTVLRRVTLPMIGPSLAAGLALTWARALGEFGATITFAGNLQGRTQTLPLAVFVALESDRDSAVALALVMVATSLAVLVLLRERWWGVP